MPQFINYDGQGRVMYYHTVPGKAGTPDFEHAGMVALSTLTNPTDRNGNPIPEVVVIACPICGATSYVPATGGPEARTLHSTTHAATGGKVGLPANANLP